MHVQSSAERTGEARVALGYASSNSALFRALHQTYPARASSTYAKHDHEPISSGRCLQIQKYFCTVNDYAGKEDLSMGYWNPKRLLREAALFFFLEIRAKRSARHPKISNNDTSRGGLGTSKISGTGAVLFLGTLCLHV